MSGSAPLGQGFEDFFNELIVKPFDRMMTRMVNEGGLADLAKAAVQPLASSVATVSKHVDNFADKVSPPTETVRDVKAQELARGIEPQALPQQAVSAAHNVQFNKSEIVAAQVVDIPSGTAVSPTAVGYGQVQQQGIAMG